MKCGYLLPVHDAALTPNHEMVGCLREEGHRFDHLSTLSDGRHILWMPTSLYCDCEEEDCQCFDYSEVSLQEAKEILASLER